MTILEEIAGLKSQLKIEAPKSNITKKSEKGKLIILVIKTSLNYKGNPIYVYHSRGEIRGYGLSNNPLERLNILEAAKATETVRLLEIADNGAGARYILKQLKNKMKAKGKEQNALDK
jgi:hypothetical protein